jgi:SRSO17 transposase
MRMPIATAPAQELTPQALANRVEELRTYHALYSPLFQRREQRESAQQYLHGLLLELLRKSIEPMVLALEGAKAKAVRTRQLCISEGAWEDEPILHRHWQAVEHTLGEDDGGLTLDGSDFLKQGQESVGVKRQYWGEVGKRATCQAGVYVGYASRRGYTLLDRRLSLPHAWVQEGAYAERRRRWGARWVVCDEAFGRDTSLRDAIAGVGLWYWAEVPHDTRVWRQRPARAIPVWTGRGRPPTRPRLLAGEVEPATVAQLAAALPPDRGRRYTIKEGSKGPLVAHLAAERVIAVRAGLPGPEVWLVLRRNVTTGALKTSLSNALADTPWATLVRLRGRRWPSEMCFEDGKQSLGMGDYEGRGWRGWHQHMTLCILAHFLLVRTHLKVKHKPRN